MKVNMSRAKYDLFIACMSTEEKQLCYRHGHGLSLALTNQKRLKGIILNVGFNRFIWYTEL